MQRGINNNNKIRLGDQLFSPVAALRSWGETNDANNWFPHRTRMGAVGGERGRGWTKILEYGKGGGVRGEIAGKWEKHSHFHRENFISLRKMDQRKADERVEDAVAARAGEESAPRGVHFHGYTRVRAHARSRVSWTAERRARGRLSRRRRQLGDVSWFVLQTAVNVGNYLSEINAFICGG